MLHSSAGALSWSAFLLILVLGLVYFLCIGMTIIVHFCTYFENPVIGIIISVKRMEGNASAKCLTKMCVHYYSVCGLNLAQSQD